VTAPARWELLSGLTDQQRDAVLATTRTCHFRAKEVLFVAGDPGHSLHLVVSGRVAVRAVTPTGEEATFALLGPGQALGEMALMRRSRTRTASAYALEDVETKALHRDDFFRLCDAQPAVERVLVSLLAARVDRLSHQLMDALYRSVEERIARRLLDAARLYPDAGDGLVLPLTQQDIASLAGTTRPTANIVLNDLQGLGIVALSRGRVVIRDLRGLAAHAGS
jgi:CRP-like cAMP-binding protein